MSVGMILLIGVAVFAGAVFLFVMGVFNNLVKLRNRFKNAYSQIDVQLTRRYELIPNLVETAKGYMSHEKETLAAVIEARNQAQKITLDLSKAPGDPKLMEKLTAAEGSLTKSMGSFFALAESYPDLKADSTMNNLMEELTSTENKVSFARQGYNDSVTEYNTKREMFPSNIIAGAFNFKEASLFEIETKEAREAVKVSF